MSGQAEGWFPTGKAISRGIFPNCQSYQQRDGSLLAKLSAEG